MTYDGWLRLSYSFEYSSNTVEPRYKEVGYNKTLL